MSDEIAELRHKVALSCRMLGHQGVTKGSFGHVSARIPGSDHVLIKSKGPDEEALEFATERDVITIRLDGSVVEASDGLEAPHETAMHLAVYRARPEISSVIHSHPEPVVVLTACEKPLVPMYGAYDGQASLRLLEEGIPTYPRSITVTDDELGAEFMAVMGSRRACLLRGHGLTTAGGSVEEATLTSLRVFELARLNYLAYAIGGPLPVPDLEDHRRRAAEGRGRPPRTGVMGASEWRYQRKLLEVAGLDGG
ncbi:MAG TPA: class II aldolase/adducin family protein [Chloroflexota bacterium]